MEQRDYILREIEKLGAILRAIRRKFAGGKDNLSISFEEQTGNAKEMLLNEMNFNLDKFLELNTFDSNEYICSFQGFSVVNIELLAEYLSQTGFNNECNSSKKYLEKSLQLYDLCNLKDKTYSLEREANIKAIKNAKGHFL